MEIQTPDYFVGYDASTQSILFKGSLRLNGVEAYAPVNQILNSVVEKKPDTLTLDLTELKFLNSSGINMLSKFVIRVRQMSATQLIVKGSQTISWQSKSLKNLHRLMPTLRLEIE
ncbi:MAG: slr1659 superfamily regulator [Elainellaceae cyanobacterium]